MDQSQETKLTLRASNTEHATGSKRGKTLRPPRMVTCMVSRAFHRLHVFSALVLKVLLQFGFLLMHACGYDHQTSLSGSCCTKRSKTGHPTRSRRVVGSNPIWGSDFFRVYVSPRIYVISCCCYFSVSILT